MISRWWFGTFFIFPHIGNNNPNWLTHIFQVAQPPPRFRPWNPPWGQASRNANTWCCCRSSASARPRCEAWAPCSLSCCGWWSAMVPWQLRISGISGLCMHHVVSWHVSEGSSTLGISMRNHPAIGYPHDYGNPSSQQLGSWAPVPVAEARCWRGTRRSPWAPPSSGSSVTSWWPFPQLGIPILGLDLCGKLLGQNKTGAFWKRRCFFAKLLKQPMRYFNQWLLACRIGMPGTVGPTLLRCPTVMSQHATAPARAKWMRNIGNGRLGLQKRPSIDLHGWSVSCLLLGFLPGPPRPSVCQILGTTVDLSSESKWVFSSWFWFVSK